MLQSISIINNNGQKLSSYILFGKQEPKLILIACHGFRGKKENSGKIFNFAERLNKIGIGVVAFDFSGSGASDGEFADMTLSSQVSDLKAVVEYVYSQYNTPIVLLGRSFGGSTVLAYGGNDDRIAGYIFWSTVVKLKENFKDILGEQYLSLIAGNNILLTDESGDYFLKPELIKDFDRHDMDQKLLTLGNKPVLIVHGMEDEDVSPDDARYIKEHVQNGCLFLVDDADHRFINKTLERENITINWIKKFILGEKFNAI